LGYRFTFGCARLVCRQVENADSAARAAVEIADLVLIPCRSSAFDLPAIQTSAKLVQLSRKLAFPVFTAGSPNTPRTYAETGELVGGFGTPACPIILPDRAFTPCQRGGPHRHGSRPWRQGRRGVRSLCTWIVDS
jgi:chromosome partitioning protein